MDNNTTIVIPTIKINQLLIKVLKKTVENIPNIYINIIANEISLIPLNTEKIRIIQTYSQNMSEKRNLGVQEAKTEYIGFIDSDAYPSKNWLKNGIRLLNENKEIGIITGPELSFPDQTFIENIIGLCNKSFLITGSHSFRKSLSSSRFYSEASGCNILMRKKDFFDLKGMNENLYLGEDRDFSERLIKDLKKKIYFSKDSWIFHKDRGLIGFFFQRFARGEAINDTVQVILKSIKKDLSLKNILNQRLELFIPFLFILFIVSYFITFIFYEWFFIYIGVLSAYIIIIILNALKLCKSKFYFFPIVSIILMLGTITPGVAQIFKLFKVKFDISKFYRNSNDR